MKKFYFFFLVFIVLSIQTSLAQREHGELLKIFKKNYETITSIDSSLVESVMVYSVNGINNRYNYTYDENGNMLISALEIFISGKWSNSERLTRTFDEMGNVLTILTEQTTGDDWWFGKNSSTFTYNEDGNQLAHTNSKFNDGIWKWVYDFKFTFVYDSKGNNTSLLKEIWQNDQWVNDSRYTYIYDSDDHQLSTLDELWQNGQWVNSSQITYTYDENGYSNKFLRERWQNGQWVNFQQNTWTNDSNGNQLTSLNERWQNEQWVSIRRISQTYDSNGNSLTWVAEEWANGDWIVTQQEEFTYDSKGNKLTYYNEFYTDGVLVFAEKDYYTYDSYGNELTFIWKELVDGVYEYRDQRISTYNNDGKVLTILYQTWDGSQWTNTDYSLSFQDSKKRYFYFTGYKIEVTYQGTVAVEEEKGLISKSLVIYPNPVSDYLNISYSLTQTGSIEIYDVVGNKVYISELQEKVDVSNLTEGMYYLIINAGNKTETKKFLMVK